LRPAALELAPLLVEVAMIGPDAVGSQLSFKPRRQASFPGKAKKITGGV
jgi:hypothetical protein